jgi:diacylglycerol kinase (ATP)
MKKAIFAYNPLSGQRSVPAKLDYIIKRFMQEDVLLQPYRIYDGQKEKLVRVLKESNYSYMVISGGDGTISSIVDGMLKNNINLPIGVIPSGTCNDFL